MADATVLRAVLGGAASRAVNGFEVGYLTEDGAEHRVELADAWSARFVSCLPVRRFPSYEGQRHFQACTGCVDGLPWVRFDRPAG
jgi:hypothetical protein